MNETADKLFISTSSPHLRDTDSINKIMWTVNVALIPALIMAYYFFGTRALWITLLAVVAAVATEALVHRVAGKSIRIHDGSAVITGILLAFNLPASAPWWMPIVGSVFAIVIVKELFGGLGNNILNPALAARAFLLASWPVEMTASWVSPREGTLSGISAITSATPLSLLKDSAEIIANPQNYEPGRVQQAQEAIANLSSSYSNLLIGNVGGCIGETSVIALLIGALFMFYRHVLTWQIPFTYIGTVALLAWIFGGSEGLFTGNWIFHILSGGLILGAFYMATDMVTSPLNSRGQIIFGVGCGILTVAIRLWGGYPEGVSYSIILMNLAVPLIDRYTVPSVFGEVNKK
ncbi:MAG: RnfABCDGE type electron transport complex subunit D [Calditrichaeota bacterium]|nr:RnfABCDGE type electron transport complex subunit D [Calditrichota bacterium]RQV99272.1 MAG: RnfABCDGE type electron transport complex subunit D [Calditrichota bacterium]